MEKRNDGNKIICICIIPRWISFEPSNLIFLSNLSSPLPSKELDLRKFSQQQQQQQQLPFSIQLLFHLLWWDRIERWHGFIRARKDTYLHLRSVSRVSSRAFSSLIRGFKWWSGRTTSVSNRGRTCNLRLIKRCLPRREELEPLIASLFETFPLHTESIVKLIRKRRMEFAPLSAFLLPPSFFRPNIEQRKKVNLPRDRDSPPNLHLFCTNVIFTVHNTSLLNNKILLGNIREIDSRSNLTINDPSFLSLSLSLFPFPNKCKLRAELDLWYVQRSSSYRRDEYSRRALFSAWTAITGGGWRVSLQPNQRHVTDLHSCAAETQPSFPSHLPSAFDRVTSIHSEENETNRWKSIPPR